MLKINSNIEILKLNNIFNLNLSLSPKISGPL